MTCVEKSWPVKTGGDLLRQVNVNNFIVRPYRGIVVTDSIIRKTN